MILIPVMIYLEIYPIIKAPKRLRYRLSKVHLKNKLRKIRTLAAAPIQASRYLRGYVQRR